MRLLFGYTPALLLFGVWAFLLAPPGFAQNEIAISTADNIRYGLWPAVPSKPAPTLFVFATTIEATLGDPYYRQCGQMLAEHGWVCVSLDLPCHGTDQRPGEPPQLEGWRHRVDADEDFIAPFAVQVGKVLDHLIAQGHTDPERIAACGTSRGGFMALQMAAAQPRIRAAAGFSPVTALATLREFHGAENSPLTQSLSLLPRAPSLAGRAVWVVIGDQDERVGTDDAIAFVRAVTRASLEQGKTPQAVLHVMPQKGHSTPEGAPQLAAEWMMKVVELLPE